MGSSGEALQTDEMKRVELCYCAVNRIYRRQLDVAASSQIAQIIQLAGVLIEFPELQQQEVCYGIYGKLKSGEYVPHAGDRIEIYRPLMVDPMEARRRRVTKKTKRNTRTF